MDLKNRIILVTFLIFCACALWYAFYQRGQLFTNVTQVSGEIEAVSYTSKSSDYFVKYHFNFQGKLIYAMSSIPYSKFRDVLVLDSLLKGRIVPVLYQKDNPNNSRMLLTTRDYREFDIEIPAGVRPIVNQLDILIHAGH